MASVSAPIKKVRYISVIFRLLIPRLSGKSNRIAIAATAGIVKPILASAEPSAKFKLLCNRLALATLKAAKLSGNSTSIAIAIPTTALGAPIALTAASMVGLSNLAKMTTAIREINNSAPLTMA